MRAQEWDERYAERQQWSAGFALLWVAGASKTMVETPP